MTLLILKGKIINGDILGTEVFENIDLEDVLDGRDDDTFDKSWIDTFNRLKNFTLSDEEKKMVDDIREISFKVTYAKCKDSELSAYISDDFELIAKAFLFNISEPFVNGLWKCYKNNIIPGGKIEYIEGKIIDL